MPIYHILLPPLMTDRLIEADTVELTEEAAAPLLLTGTLKLIESASKETATKPKAAKPTE